MIKNKKVFMFVIFAAFMMLLAGCQKKEDVEEIVKIPVETIKAERKDISKAIIVSGITEPEITVKVMPEIMKAEKIVGVPVNVGDYVKKGQPIVYLSKTNSSLSLEISEANYLDAKNNYDRNKALFDAGAISKSNFEKVELSYLSAKNNYEMQKIDFDNHSIKSPISGYVSEIMVEEGNLASMQQAVAVITKNDVLKIKADVNEKVVKKIAQGEPVTVMIPSLGDKLFDGELKSVAPSMDKNIKAYPIEVELTNKDLEISPGMYGKVEIQTDKRQDVLLVPTESILVRGNQARIYVVRGDKAVLTKVQIGLSNKKNSEVLSGLNEGEMVVTRGNENIIDGDFIRTVKPIEDQIKAADEAKAAASEEQSQEEKDNAGELDKGAVN